MSDRSESMDVAVAPAPMPPPDSARPITPITPPRPRGIRPAAHVAIASESADDDRTPLIVPSPPIRVLDDMIDHPDLLVPSALAGDASTARANVAGAPNRRYGLMLDVGVPDGATAALVMRPMRAFRLNAGISYNGISYGVRGGITWIPLATWASPTLSFDYGHYTDGDANPLARLVSGNPMFSSPALDRVGYDYADAHVGLELGRGSFTFYIHAGVSRVTGSVHDLGTVTSGKMVTFGSDPAVTLTTVSARLGLVFYLAK